MVFFQASSLFAQAPLPLQQSEGDSLHTSQKIIVVTGARFSYQLMERWIDDYNKLNPGVQIIIESRGSADPHNYDVLAEVYPHPEEIQKKRHYIKVGRYAILPVATSNSPFARHYADKGVNKEKIVDIFFHDIFNDKGRKGSVHPPFTPYTRLQKAGVPSVFANYFGYEQKDLKGNAIAGADAHLLKAVLRDSVGVTYLPLPLIYDRLTRLPVEGLTVLPVDFDGNGKVSDDEKFYNNVDTVIDKLEKANPADVRNIPIGYLHLSVDKAKAKPEAIEFLKWVQENAQSYLQQFGYLKPGQKDLENDKHDEFAAKREQH